VRALLAAALLLGACGKSSLSGPGLAGMTPDNHAAYFPIANGEHALDCATCHTNAATFAEYSCTGCHTHDHAPTDLVHNSVGTYTYASASCYQCHPSPVPGAFSHRGIIGGCASCHAAGASFAALPRPGFTHLDVGSTDCGSCHTTASWAAGAVPGTLVHDPSQDLTVAALVPSYSATSIVKVTPASEPLSMSMDHHTAALASAVLTSCTGCHAGAAGGTYYPGVLHSSLANQGLAQPAACLDCHADAMPTGLVGPTAAHPPRNPASGEMKHDAVAWSGNAPTTTRLVTADCGTCHASPSATLAATWATGRAGAGPTYHASLTSAKQAQPTSCLDCHANTRPAVITSTGASLPSGLSFDHGAAAILGDCAGCHAASAAGGFASWAGGRLHAAGGAAPTSCLPCHGGERPTSSAGWASATYTASPFDYGTNAAGITHGDGQDCAACHQGPGTGAWGSTQNWQGGRFAHGAATVAGTTCIACHASQRPDLQPGATAASVAALLGFDHAVNGTGDCSGCHQATVAAGKYVNYVNPSTRALPGGDWKGGAAYPGDQLASAGDQLISLTELTLVRTGARVTGVTSATATLYNGMLHTSPAIPGAVNPGPAASPDYASCWHCHTSTGGTVTGYANGQFHKALAAYAATPGGAVTPLPQPTSRCADCHAQMRPAGIVEKGGSDLQPMDHAALFTAAVTIGGQSAGGVAGLDCSACHHSPGTTWADGVFHASIGSATPQDCTVCHYPLMADSARADVASGALYVMTHRSAQVAQQRCDLCHTSALARATGTPPATSAWNPGAFHAGVAAQPTACLDCHAGSAPTAPTQSSVTYALAAGGTSTNGGQWMSHASAAGVDCVKCHAADARAAGAAWSKSTPYHASVASAASCRTCHGLTNGNGATAGAGNNLPAGLTASSMVTSAAADATTGVPAGTHDQLTHADVNANGQDCSFCHTQAGPSAVAGVQGKEWAQASFHVRFSSATPLTMNGTTGRCSNCHLNVKPAATFAAMDHSSLTSASGSQDCSACHSWPGTGTSGSPNWLGASGSAPQFIFVGGFTIPRPPATATTTQTGIANLPHPSTATLACSTCHTGGAGGKGAVGYDHASTLINTNCSSCHEAGTNLVGTPWNGATTQSAGAGDSRPFTLTSLKATRSGSGSCTINTANHFYPVDCSQCHKVPAGTGAVTTGTAYTNAWTFPHSNSAMTNPSTCQLCHSQPGCGT
jgi:hypothetical protein